MIRKLSSVVIALLCVAGFAAGAAAGSGTSTGIAAAPRAAVLPSSGNYHGLDHHQRTISFTYHGNQISNFKVNSHTIGNVHVSGGAWHQTCAGGYCTMGHWQTDTHVVGSWRTADGHWIAWAADLPVQPTNYQGTYRGSDHLNHTVTFSRSGAHVKDFMMGGNSFGEATIHGGAWPETCKNGWCYKGHWQDDYHVVGEWRQHGGTWHAWEARAYAS